MQTQDLVRDVKFAMDISGILISFLISAQFIGRALKYKHEARVSLGWAAIFAGMGLVSLLIAVYFYFLSPDLKILYLDFITAIGSSVIIYAVVMFEYFYQRFKKTRYIITIIGIICFTINFLPIQPFNNYLIISYFLLLFTFTLAFFAKLIKLSAGRVRHLVIFFVISFYVMMLGNIFAGNPNSEQLWNVSGEILGFTLGGRLLRIIAILVIKYVLGELPIFMEVNWREQLISLMVVYKKTGVLIRGHHFQEAVPAPDGAISEDFSDELRAGGFFGITTLLKEMAQSETPLNIIDHGDLKIMLEHGEHVLIVLYVSEEMRIYREKLEILRKRIENLFQDVFKSWNGDVNIFQPIMPMISEIFQPT